MKKIIFTTLVFMSMQHISKAQVQVSYGVEAGATSSLINSIDDPALDGVQKSTYTSGGGFYLGGVAHINRGKGFSFQTGLRYTAISAKEKIDIFAMPTTRITGEVKMNFVEIPLNFVFKSTTTKCKCLSKVYGFFGPQIGIAVSGNSHYKVTGQPDQHKDLEFGKGANQYKRMQLSFAGGVGYQLSKKMNFQASYQFGMNDIDNTTNYSTRFSSLKLGLQYFFK